MQSSILTRARFGAYDPETWTIQTYLAELGFDPGPADGLWGSKTIDAALAFREWQGFEPASDLTKSAIATEDFLTYLDRATASAGFEINIEPPLSMPSGSGTGPVVRPGGGGASTVPRPTPHPAATPSTDLSLLLPLAILGVGAYVAFGGKKKGR